MTLFLTPLGALRSNHFVKTEVNMLTYKEGEKVNILTYSYAYHPAARRKPFILKVELEKKICEVVLKN